MATIARMQITFGLVAIPVSIHPAVRRADVPLHEVHTANGARRHRPARLHPHRPAGSAATGRPYYLSAPDTAGRPYALLRAAMREAGLAGVARMALRSRESLAVLTAREDVLVATTLVWPDEILPTAGLAPDAPAPRRQEIQMARTLMDQLTEGFRWEDQHDAYRHALEQVVAARLEGVEPPHAEPAEAAPVVDLMAALEASVEAARERRRTS